MQNNTKTVTIEGQDFVLGRIKSIELRDGTFEGKEGTRFNLAYLAASLRAGGNAEATEDWVCASVDLFYDDTFNKLFSAATEVNRAKKAAQTGESQPAGPASDSTSITSTVQ